MQNYRKTIIAENLSKLITENTEYTVANLLVSVLRNKNNSNSAPEPYNMSDEDISSTLEKMVLELSKTED
jgi:hypothetical protein